MQTHTLSAELRAEKGKNANNKLRSNGFIPAVVYSHGTAESIKIQSRELSRIFKGHISESVLLNLQFKDKSDSVFIKDYQRDPVTDQVLHLDFFKVTADEKIHTHIPVEVIGNATGVRKGGILEHIERELEIECLPRDLQEKIQIDVTNLEMGESIHIKDLRRFEGISFLGDPDRVIVTVLAPSKVKEEGEEAVEAVAEVAEGSESGS